MLDAREEISLCRLEKAGPVAMTNVAKVKRGKAQAKPKVCRRAAGEKAVALATLASPPRLSLPWPFYLFAALHSLEM